MARKKPTVDNLVRRATAGKVLDRRVVFRPSMAYALLHDPFSVWCEHHAPKDSAVDETTRFERLRMQWGSDYEERWVAKNHPDAVRIAQRWGIEALQDTLRAILDGAPAIHQAHLWDLGLGVCGIGDVLVRRDDAPSDLGPFHSTVARGWSARLRWTISRATVGWMAVTVGGGRWRGRRSGCRRGRGRPRRRRPCRARR